MTEAERKRKGGTWIYLKCPKMQIWNFFSSCTDTHKHTQKWNHTNLHLWIGIMWGWLNLEEQRARVVLGVDCVVFVCDVWVDSLVLPVPDRPGRLQFRANQSNTHSCCCAVLFMWQTSLRKTKGDFSYVLRSWENNLNCSVRDLFWLLNWPDVISNVKSHI